MLSLEIAAQSQPDRNTYFGTCPACNHSGYRIDVIGIDDRRVAVAEECIACTHRDEYIDERENW